MNKGPLILPMDEPDLTQRIFRDLIQTMLYHPENIDHNKLSNMFMDEPTIEKLRNEIVHQMKEAMSKRAFIVLETFRTIVLNPEISLMSISFIPAVVPLHDKHYYVARLGQYIGDAYFEDQFVVGPDPEEPDVLRFGANVTFVPKEG